MKKGFLGCLLAGAMVFAANAFAYDQGVAIYYNQSTGQWGTGADYSAAAAEVDANNNCPGYCVYAGSANNGYVVLVVSASMNGFWHGGAHGSYADAYYASMQACYNAGASDCVARLEYDSWEAPASEFGGPVEYPQAP